MRLFKNDIIRRLTVVILAMITGSFTLYATHNRAGEITLRQISDLTYEIKITTFTYTLSPADRNQLEVQWGDNTTSIAPRISAVLLGNNYRQNIYIAQHTFPGQGTYEIVVQDPNRNFGVKNIPNSVNVIFSIKTTITVNTGIGENSTPVLLNPPIDKAALGQLFIHNPAAFDYDGDSISYSLTVCTKENGEPIENYSFPDASDSLYVDPVTGDLVWNTPVDTGIYNIAMNVEEWRDGIKIGNIVRDMQVEVYRTDNHAPRIDSMEQVCIVAGEQFTYDVIARDQDGDNMSMSFTGGPYAFGDSIGSETLTDSSGLIIKKFTWNTDCRHPRLQPYNLVVKVEDNNGELNLIDIKTLFIKVMAPSPEGLQIIPSSNSVNLLWEQYNCPDIKGYRIYRKEGSSDIMIDSCSGGIPSGAGFEPVGTVNSLTNTTFQDNNKGNGLLQGVEYCYRITAILADGSESFPSEEICTTLIPGSPSLLNASVTNVAEEGSVFISWAKPRSLDTIPANGPYEYIIYRSDDLWGRNLTQIHSFTTNDLNDTSYVDQPVNTLVYPYSYSVELYNNEPGNRFMIGQPEVASTFYPFIDIGDNQLKLSFRRNVPWLNTEYTIYRRSSGTTVFDSIAYTEEETYTDTNLVNGAEYCYYVRSRGFREIDGVIYNNENFSHINCGIPGDTVAPCPPQFNAYSDCENLFNSLEWNYRPEDDECSEDVVQYYIYYTPQIDLEYIVLDSLKGRENTGYQHYPETGLAGCYYVTALDSFRNESQPSLILCLDECAKYEIPNVFSPNNDQINDILHPYEYQDVEKIDLKIFNRWGQVVFETEDPDINWDGKIKGSNNLVSPGVYYYICDVYEQRLTGLEVRNLVGFIHVFHEKGAKNEFQDQTDF